MSLFAPEYTMHVYNARRPRSCLKKWTTNSWRKVHQILTYIHSFTDATNLKFPTKIAYVVFGTSHFPLHVAVLPRGVKSSFMGHDVGCLYVHLQTVFPFT